MHHLTPDTIPLFRSHLDDPARKVYLVLGSQDDLSWRVARAVMGDFPWSETWLAAAPEVAAEWLDRPEAGGWPPGTPCPDDAVPAGVCFGFGYYPVFYLTREQAEDDRVVAAAHHQAGGQTDKGGEA